MRDSQKGRMYQAERDAKISHAYKHSGWTPLTIAECQALVDKAIASPYIVRHYPGIAGRKIRVIAGRNGGWANGYTISLGVWARQEAIVWHEFAHCLVGNQPWHGWQFCEAFLLVVRHFMGADAAARLEEAFKANRVRYRKPRQVTMSPERRAAAAATLAAARKGPVAPARPTFTTPDDAPYHSHMCATCDRRLPATKFPTTRTPGVREAICRECRDSRK